MQPIEFRAPWSRSLKVVTGFTVTILCAVFVAGLVSAASGAPTFASVALMATPLLIAVGALPFMVRGYRLTEREITVERLGWRTRLPLEGLNAVRGDAEAMSGALRLFGNGGLYSFTGKFWNRRLGRFRALATDPSRAVVLEYADRTIVITPHDPQHFIMRARTLMKHSTFERAMARR